MLRQSLYAVILAVAASHAAALSPVTFFGENLAPGGRLSGPPLDAQAAFLSHLTGTGTEDFEALAGSGALTLTFPGSLDQTITATLTGAGTRVNHFPSSGRFATSGGRYVETGNNGDFRITFSVPISAFGFFGTDLGDHGNGLVLVLTAPDGGATRLVVPITRGVQAQTDGALHFFGFIDHGQGYVAIDFLNTGQGGDVFGFDDMTVGDRGQILIGHAPALPPTLTPAPLCSAEAAWDADPAPAQKARRTRRPAPDMPTGARGFS